MALGDILNRDLFRFRSLSQNPGFFERFIATLVIAGCVWLGYLWMKAPSETPQRSAAAAGNGRATAEEEASSGADYGLVIARPLSGTLVRGDHVLVDGTLQADDVTVTVDGEQVPVANRYFRATVPVKEGQNVIEVTARGRAGAQTSQTVVLRDTQPPQIRILQPGPDATVGQRVVTIRGEVDDVAPARVSIGGHHAQLGPDGIFYGATALEPGENTVEIVAEDRAGNRATHQLTVTLDSEPPIVVIRAPADGLRTRADAITVRGQVDEAVRDQVLVNGLPVPVRGKQFETTLRLTREGKQTILVNALDAAGNATRQTVTIFRDTQPPSLVDWSISGGTIRGTANEVLSRATIAGVGAIVDGKSFSGKSPAKSEGDPRAIEIRLVDEAGNESVTEVTEDADQ